MLEILQYATSGFWTFIGCFALLCLAAVTAESVVLGFVRALRGR